MDDLVLVYRITCLATGKLYFGITRKTLAWRWGAHVKESRAKRFDTVLYRAIRKHGPENFTIETVYEAVNAHEAQMCERALIGAYGSLSPAGMNTSTGGEHHAGRAVVPAVRAKISAAKRGVKMSAESRAKMSMSRTGKKRSPECRERMRTLANRPEVRAKVLANSQTEVFRSRSSTIGTAVMKRLWQDPEFRARRARDLAVLNARKIATKKSAIKGRGKRGAMLARWRSQPYREKMLRVLRDKKTEDARSAAIALSNISRRGKPHSPEAKERRLRKNEERLFGPATASVRAMVRELPPEYMGRAR